MGNKCQHEKLHVEGLWTVMKTVSSRKKRTGQ
jgi:hypothetical protein